MAKQPAKSVHLIKPRKGLGRLPEHIGSIKRKIAELREFDPELLEIAVDCIGSKEGALSWLTRPAFGLRGKVPVKVSGTARGRAAVVTLLRRIDFGILA